MKALANFLASWLQIVISGLLVIASTWLKLYEISYPDIFLLLAVIAHSAGLILRFLNFGARKSKESKKAT